MEHINETLAFVLFFLLINTVMNIGAFIRYKDLIKGIKELWLFVENGFLQDIFDIEQEELATLSNDTDKERSLLSYVASLRTHINNFWHNYKVQGIEIIADNTSINFIEFAVKEALYKTSISESFIKKVESINKMQSDSFLRKLRILIPGQTTPEKIMRKELLLLYRKNIRTVYDMFQREAVSQVKPLPTKPDLLIKLREELQTKLILSDDPKEQLRIEHELNRIANYI